MAKIKNDPLITADLVRKRFIYDKDTGVFTYRDNFSSKARKGKVAGMINGHGPYLYIGINYKRYASHRLAWLYVYGEWPKSEIDHVNGICTDNRIENLRDALPRHNQYNQRLPKNNKSGVKGVCWNSQRKKWMAQVATTAENGSNGYLGLFSTIAEAAEAVRMARAKLHGEFANDG